MVVYKNLDMDGMAYSPFRSLEAFPSWTLPVIAKRQ
jgi:hypothetical protein